MTRQATMKRSLATLITLSFLASTPVLASEAEVRHLINCKVKLFMTSEGGRVQFDETVIDLYKVIEGRGGLHQTIEVELGNYQTAEVELWSTFLPNEQLDGEDADYFYFYGAIDDGINGRHAATGELFSYQRGRFRQLAQGKAKVNGFDRTTITATCEVTEL